MSLNQVMKNFKQLNPFCCRVCEEKDKKISYLEKLVDNLLLKNGVAPVMSDAPKMEDLEDEGKVPEGTVRFGG